jgi:hypothetical protein
MQRYHLSLDTNVKDTEDGASTVVQSPIDVEKDHGQKANLKLTASFPSHDFPDGGLRAWLIVCGVCVSYHSPRSFF